MKPDYKNWTPKGMLFSLIAGTVLSLALLLVFGVFGVCVSGKLRIVLDLCECGEPIHHLSPEKHQQCPYEADLNAIREKFYNKPSEEQEKAYREYGEKHLKEEFPLYWQKIAEHQTPEQEKATTPKIKI